jgi:formate hydrogenlyase transcriptional activator
MGTAPQLGKGRVSGQIPGTERYKVLKRILRAIGSHRDADAVFRAWVAELRCVINPRAIGLAYYNEFLGDLQWCAMDIDDQASPMTPLVRWEHSALRWVYESQEPLIMNLADGNFRFAAAVEFLGQMGMRTACLLPLTTVYRRLGAVVFASEHPQYFSNDMIDFLSVVADQVALGMDNNFNFAASEAARTRLERETGKLKLLLELNNAIVSDLELSSLLHAISPCLRRLIQADAVALILPDSEDRGLRLHTVDFPNSPGQSLKDFRFQHRDSIAARVFHSGKLWIGNISSSDPPGKLDAAPDSGLKTVCALPLIRRKRVLGVLGLGTIDETEFSAQDVEFLLQVANQVAIAVDNALA